MGDVFISYSRKDQGFVRRIHDALHRIGRDTWVDWEGIPPTAEWMAEIRAAIESADNFMIVISPYSVASPHCRQEIDHAVLNRKRILPVLAHDVDAAAVHASVASINWILFRDGDPFESSFQQLIRAIDTDLAWVKEGTRILVAARRWESRDHGSASLLRGSELSSAETWLARAGAQEEMRPTQLQVEYVNASRREATKRLRVLLGSVSAGGVFALVLAALAVWQWRVAEQRRKEAFSRQLASQAELARAQSPDQLPRSALLALESLRIATSAETRPVLREAIRLLPRLLGERKHTAAVQRIAFTPDGAHLVSAARDGSVRVWDVQADRDAAGFGVAGELRGLALSPDGRSLAAAAGVAVEVRDLPSARLRWRLDHEGEAVCAAVAFSPTGRYLGTTTGSAARIWDVEAGTVVARVEHGVTPFTSNAIAFSPDEKIFATAGWSDNTARLWTVAGGSPAGEVGHGYHVVAVAYGAKRGWFATAARDSRSSIREPGGTKEAVSLLHPGFVDDLDFSPDERRLVTASGDTVWIWRAPQWTEERRLPQNQPVREVRFSPDGRSLAVAAGNVGRVWRVSEGREYARLSHEAEVTSLVFNPGSDRLASASADGTVRLWSATAGPEVLHLEAGRRATALAFSLDGRRLALAAAPALRITDIADGHEVARFPLDKKAGSSSLSLAFSPDGARLAVGGASTSGEPVLAKVWHLASGRATPLPHEDGITSLTFSPNGRYLASSGWESVGRLWDSETGKVVASFQHEGDVRSIAFSPDGKRVATGSTDHQACVWDVPTARRLHCMPHEGPVWWVAFSPDSRQLATANHDGSATVWDAARGARIATEKHSSSALRIVFSPDGRRVASASSEDVRVWEPASQRRVASASLKMVNFPYLGFSPDGGYVITSGPADAYVWNAGTGGLEVRLRLDGIVRALAASPEGGHIAAADDDGHVSAWLWRLEDLAAESWVCGLIPRNLTPTEWIGYFSDQPYRKVCATRP